MRVQVLGAYGSLYYEKNGVTCRHYGSSSFRVNESILIDAGSVSGGALNLGEITRLRYIFLSHAHLDHIHGLPFVFEILYGKSTAPLVVVSTDAVLAALKDHIFNDSIWPDFTRIPNESNPLLRYWPIEVRKPVAVEGLKIEAVPVNHTVPAVGFLVENDRSAFVYSGDTGPTEEIWERASRLKLLSAAFIESTFPDRFGELATLSKHLTPASTYQSFRRIKNNEIPCYAYHMKVPYLAELRKEFDLLQGKEKRVYLLENDQVLKL